MIDNLTFLLNSLRVTCYLHRQLPATTGSSLGATEGDPIVQQTIAALEKISETKLALVAPGLTAVLEGFISVCPVSCVFHAERLTAYPYNLSKRPICL